MSEEPIVEPIASPKGDFKKLGRNSQAVVGELREFLANLKGKSPKEMMGAVAESSLAQSLLISTVIMSILVFAFSAIPYFLKDQQASLQAAQEGTTVEDNPTEQPATPSGSGESSSGDAGSVQETETSKTPEQKTADILGVGEVADPDSNPLDSGGDDLLDGLDDL
jgi:hypothetical protein